MIFYQIAATASKFNQSNHWKIKLKILIPISTNFVGSLNVFECIKWIPTLVKVVIIQENEAILFLLFHKIFYHYRHCRNEFIDSLPTSDASLHHESHQKFITVKNSNQCILHGVTQTLLHFNILHYVSQTLLHSILYTSKPRIILHTLHKPCNILHSTLLYTKLCNILHKVLHKAFSILHSVTLYIVLQKRL